MFAAVPAVYLVCSRRNDDVVCRANQTAHLSGESNDTTQLYLSERIKRHNTASVGANQTCAQLCICGQIKRHNTALHLSGESNDTTQLCVCRANPNILTLMLSGRIKTDQFAVKDVVANQNESNSKIDVSTSLECSGSNLQLKRGIRISFS
jgi:hypothetical protein